MTTRLSSQNEPGLLPGLSPEFPGVLASPRREQTPEGQLYRFRHAIHRQAIVERIPAANRRARSEERRVGKECIAWC